MFSKKIFIFCMFFLIVFQPVCYAKNIVTEKIEQKSTKCFDSCVDKDSIRICKKMQMAMKICFSNFDTNTDRYLCSKSVLQDCYSKNPKSYSSFCDFFKSLIPDNPQSLQMRKY